MADNERPATECNLFVEPDKRADRPVEARAREQRLAKVKDKWYDSDLPTPPPDPWTTPKYPEDRRARSTETGRPRSATDEEDIIAYLAALGTPPPDFRASECPSRASATSAASATAATAASFCAEEPFEHLDRLYGLAEQILELRARSSRYFRRVRELERLKASKGAERRAERAIATGEAVEADLADEDTGFAESLLDAMLSNCRDAQLQRWAVRSPSSRRGSRSLVPAEPPVPRPPSSVAATRLDPDRRPKSEPGPAAPKVSKWTRVKAAFKWERACANDVAESSEAAVNAATTSNSPTAKYLRIPDVGPGSWSGSTMSPSNSEVSGPTSPAGRVSSVSSSNEDVFDAPRRSVPNQCERQAARPCEERRKCDQDRQGRSTDGDPLPTAGSNAADRASEASQARPVIRVTSETTGANAQQPPKVSSSNEGEREADSKRPTPMLTITIPSNEEELRSVSSPESASPLPSSAMDSGDSSPQRAKTRQDASVGDFKRQLAAMEEPASPRPKMQRQDSKWNKVRRAFLTNAAFSVPPSPVRVVAGQTFPQDFAGSPRARSCGGSVEDLDKTATGASGRAETRRDYQALREKLGAEFHRKLVEWERLKGSSPRVATRSVNSAAPTSPRASLPLAEDRLAPEFKKKLQEWKRAKKGRRASVSIEQQRASRRRLTDWQLWRSPLKPDARQQERLGPRGSCGSVGSAGSGASDGRPHLCEDFVRRMEEWRRINEISQRGAEPAKRTACKRFDTGCEGVDESEFVALEKILSARECVGDGDRRASDAKRADSLSGEEARLASELQDANNRSEILIRTSVGSYRFEGISREFTRKLYDWEKYRGISPGSSTFRLLAPGYAPFAAPANDGSSTAPVTSAGEEKMFLGGLKRSKSTGSIAEGSGRGGSLMRRSTSLQSLNRLQEKLDDADRIDASPAPVDPRRPGDASEGVAMDDSEPEAVIVDIEDVIEETASPLNRVQPHQTPVYSVAASETTSIAVPLGTVTSSHEPSPVIFVEIKDGPDRDRWENRSWNQRLDDRSAEDSFASDHWMASEGWSRKSSGQSATDPDCWDASRGWGERRDSSSQDSSRPDRWERLRESVEVTNFCDRYADRDRLEESAEWSQRTDCSSQDDDSIRSCHSIRSNDSLRDELRSDLNALSLRGTSSSVANEFAERDEAMQSRGWVAKKGSIEAVKSKSASAERTSEFGGVFAPVSDDMDSPGADKRALAYEAEDEEERRRDESGSDDEEKDGNHGARDETDRSDGSAASDAASLPCRSTATRSLADYRDTGAAGTTPSTNFLSNDSGGASGASRSEIGRYIDEIVERGSRAARLHDFSTLATRTRECERIDTSRTLHERADFSRGNASFSGTDERRDRRGFDDFSSASSSRSTVDFRERAIKTTPIIVSTYRGDRGVERIIINEKTLNRIVVPTAATDSSSKPFARNEGPASGGENRSRMNSDIARDTRESNTVPSNDTRVSNPATSNDTGESNPVTLNNTGESNSMTSNDTRESNPLTSNDTHESNLVTLTDTHESNPATSSDSRQSNAESSADARESGGRKGSGCSSPSVFVKTKRIIFSPFRRGDERRPSRKNSDDAPANLRPRSASKSRSVSPKSSKQEALLRVPLSLPWPLRASSRDREADSDSRITRVEREDADTYKESSTSRDGGREHPSATVRVEEQENRETSREEENSSGEKSIFEPAERGDDVCATDKTSLSSGTLTPPLKYAESQNEISLSITPSGGSLQRLETIEFCAGRSSIHCAGSRTGSRAASRTGSRSELSGPDSLPSDLMHKLRILSNAAARRDGRVNTVSADSLSESRAARIRRAKESFLSRRGGPFCHSVADSRVVRDDNYADDWTTRHRASATMNETRFSSTMSEARFFSTMNEARFSSRTEEASRNNGSSSDRRDRSSTLTNAHESAPRNTVPKSDVTTSRRNENASTSSVVARNENDRVVLPGNEREPEARNKPASARNEDESDALSSDDSASRSDLVKSASAGMIHIDPNAFGRLETVDRGCESLPRSSKRREPSGPLARIVSKLKLSRLMRGHHAEDASMGAVSALCRQSLLMNLRQPEAEERRERGEGHGETDTSRSFFERNDRK